MDGCKGLVARATENLHISFVGFLSAGAKYSCSPPEFQRAGGYRFVALRLCVRPFTCKLLAQGTQAERRLDANGDARPLDTLTYRPYQADPDGCADGFAVDSSIGILAHSSGRDVFGVRLHADL